MSKDTTASVAAISPIAARLSIVTIIAYQVLMAALIFIRPEIDPSRQPISEYAIGRLGWIMVLAFLISAASYAALFVAIRSQVRGPWGKIGLGLLAICIIGTVGVGIFTADPIAVPMDALSTRGNLHVIFGGSALFLLPFAALLINLNLARNNSAWATARRALLWTAGVPLFGLVAFIVMVAVIVPAEGWPPRFLFLTYMVWVIVLAGQTLKVRQQNATGLTQTSPALG
jgi:Protein of unknown function (DUF998)